MTAFQPISHSDRPTHTICNPTLPLAVYREVAAHLSQVPGVEASLLSQTSSQFDYLQSQIGGLTIHYTNPSDPATQQRVVQILSYYSDRHGTWQTYSAEC